MRNLVRKQELHNRVIHVEKAASSLRAQYAESRMIKNLYGNDLYLICKQCFSKPS